MMDTSHDKLSRHNGMFAVRDEAVASLRRTHPLCDPSVFYECYNRLCRQMLAKFAIGGRRVDGRALDQLRPITCESDLHSPLHGSSLFQRGQTQVLCTVALDSVESALKTDQLSALWGGVKEKNFFV
jgi:polyribonucleotide nucleotidyltransferase